MIFWNACANLDSSDKNHWSSIEFINTCNDFRSWFIHNQRAINSLFSQNFIVGYFLSTRNDAFFLFHKLDLTSIWLKMTNMCLKEKWYWQSKKLNNFLIVFLTDYLINLLFFNILNQNFGIMFDVSSNEYSQFKHGLKHHINRY